MYNAYVNEAIQTRATVHRVFLVVKTFNMGKTTAKYLSKAKAVRVIIEQAIDDPCERRSSLQEICPKRPSFTHEWMPRNILIAVGIILKMARNRSPTYEHHHHRHHISIVFPPPPPPHFYCFPSTTTTTTFLLFSLHHRHHISIVFPLPPQFYCFPSTKPLNNNCS